MRNLKLAVAAMGLTVLLPLLILRADKSAAAESERDFGPSFEALKKLPNGFLFEDPTGAVATYTTAPTGQLDLTGPFFQDLGTNGRDCATCHEPSDGWSFSASHAKERFRETLGADPLFAMVDGGNCPDEARQDPAAHSLLLDHGLIRIPLPLPSNAQFSISVVHDPYGCALTVDPNTGDQIVSVYRRPFPSTNLRFLSAVMADSRETLVPLNDGNTFYANLVTDLTHQALDATLGHAEAAKSPSDQQLSEIVNFELSLYTAQQWDKSAGMLNRDGAQGGARTLEDQNYFPGINDPLGGNPSNLPFNPDAFSLFPAWLDFGHGHYDGETSATATRAMIAAGEKIFDTFPLTITAVSGLNDNAALGSPAAIAGTCTTCHDAPNVGDHSLPVPLDIGTSHAPAYEKNPQIAAGLSQLDNPDLPIFEIRDCPDPGNPSQTLVLFTSDPGRALITGKCADLIRTKGPILRGLAARAPYFHNGAAANLSQVVNFYNERFQMGLTDKEKAELAAFLRSL